MKQICVLWLEMVFSLTSNLKERRTIGKCSRQWEMLSFLHEIFHQIFLEVWLIFFIILCVVSCEDWLLSIFESNWVMNPSTQGFPSVGISTAFSINSSISSPYLYSACNEREKNTYSWTCLFPKLILLWGQSLNRIWSQCKYHCSTYIWGVILFILTICTELNNLPSKNVCPKSSEDTILVHISVACVSECHNILVYLG